MPLFDFVCQSCGARRDDVLVRARDVTPDPRTPYLSCPVNGEHGPMTRAASAPAHFAIHGFNSANGYAK